MQASLIPFVRSLFRLVLFLNPPVPLFQSGDCLHMAKKVLICTFKRFIHNNIGPLMHKFQR